MPNRRQILAAAAAGLPFVALRSQAASGNDDALVIPYPQQPVLPVVSSKQVFPVRRIYCVGRNYLAHIEELQHDRSQPPFFFQKQRDMLVLSGGKVNYPTMTQDYQHEIELVLAMKSGGQDISPDDAMKHVFGYAVGLDMTRRDLQNEAQSTRHPWEAGKSFEQSAPCSSITPLAKTGVLKEGRIHLTVNGKTVTDGNLKDMIWNPAEIISHLSRAFEIGPGDLIYTGTPAGVGRLNPGDSMVASIDGLEELVIHVV